MPCRLLCDLVKYAALASVLIDCVHSDVGLYIIMSHVSWKLKVMVKEKKCIQAQIAC